MGSLRIIGGEHGSRRISVPASVARPTVDRVREALFSSIGSMRGGFEGARVLDAFAGSGALALEALSRGAAFACMVDSDRQAAKVARENASSLGYGEHQAAVICADALAAPARTASFGPFDIVFLDPPYALAPAEARAFLDALSEVGALAADAVISYEHAADSTSAVEAAFAREGFGIVRQKRYGKTQVTLLTLG